MTSPEPRELAQVLDAVTVLLGESGIAAQILGVELDAAALGDAATLEAIARVVVHTDELRARLLEWIRTSIATYCTFSAQVEAVGAALTGAPIESRMRTNADLAAIQEALADVISPNGDAAAFHSILT